MYDIESCSCGTLFYEFINYLFLLWKFYLDTLAKIVLNVCDKIILPMLLSDIETDCQKYTVCTPMNCTPLRTDQIKFILFKEVVNLTQRLAQISSIFVNPYYIMMYLIPMRNAKILQIRTQRQTEEKETNSLCINLGQYLTGEFGIEVDVFVSKKKLVHLSLEKPLISYDFFKEMIEQIRRYWNKRTKCFQGHHFFYPKLNHSLKWRFDYIIVTNDKFR